MKEQIAQQCRDAVAELYEVAHLKAGDILVVGCSTSEVLGSKIGTNSAPETAVEIFNSLYGFLKEKGVYLAAQCCEHLNRAIIVEAEAVPNADIVNVVPSPRQVVPSLRRPITGLNIRWPWRRLRQTPVWTSAPPSLGCT